jgi:hypothetical protein
MQPAVDKICRHIEQQRPLHRIRDHQRHVVLTQQLNERITRKALIADLNRVPDRRVLPHARADLDRGPIVQPVIVLLRQPRRGSMGPRQQLEKLTKALGVKSQLRRKLPQDRPELLPKLQKPAREEVGQRLLGVAQLQHVRQVS